MPPAQSKNHERNLISLMRGLYTRVARQLKVHPSYVSRVARGERQSGRVEGSLERELRRTMALFNGNHMATKRKRPVARGR